MRELVLLAVLVVGALSVAYAVGRALPRGHVVSRGVRVAAPPARVWSLVASVDGYPSWRGDVLGVTRLPDVAGRPAWRERRRRGSLDFVAEVVTPPGCFVARITNTALPFGGAWRYEIHPDGAGSWVTITEEGEVRAALRRVLLRYVVGQARTLDGVLRDLAAAVAHPEAAGA